MIIRRRTFIGGSLAAAFASQGARAAAILNFEAAGGSVANSGERNRQVYVDAITRLDRIGGGTLFIPAKAYPFSGNASAKVRNVTVLASGATFRGDDCRITIEAGSTGYNIEGLTLIETSGKASAFLLNCAGSNCRFKDVHLEKRPVAKGYIGYCQQVSSGILFENFSFAGSNGIFLGGHDHEVRGGWAEAGFGDDCWVLKAASRPCYNIRISGFRARKFAALISIGSEVGSNAPDDPSHGLYVRGVTVENCTAESCVYFAYIKPGGVKPYDYRDGLVEDIAITNCSISDPTGARFRNGIYVAPARGAIVRRVAVNNLLVVARGASPAIQTIGAVYLRVLPMTNGAGQGATIEDVVLNGIRCVDPYAGAPSGPAAPGRPIQIPIAIEKERVGVGRIGGVRINGVVADGSARMGAFVGPQVSGPVTFANCEFRNFAAGVLASMDAKAIVALSPIQTDNVIATPSPLAPRGTQGLRGSPLG